MYINLWGNSQGHPNLSLFLFAIFAKFWVSDKTIHKDFKEIFYFHYRLPKLYFGFNIIHVDLLI